MTRDELVERALKWVNNNGCRNHPDVLEQCLTDFAREQLETAEAENARLTAEVERLTTAIDLSVEGQEANR